MSRMPTPRPSASLALLLGACASAPLPEPAETWTCSPRLELSQVWSFLSDKYDVNRDGRVTKTEYTRGEVRFNNYDRDQNGVLEAEDFPEDTFFNGFTHMILQQADADENKTVTHAEWASFSKSLDADGNGDMTQAEVAAVLGRWADDWRLFLLSFDQDGNGRFMSDDLQVAFRDQDFDGNGTLNGREMAGWQPTAEDSGRSPDPGTDAPDFELPLAGTPAQTVRLSDAARSRPVALIFGSYT